MIQRLRGSVLLAAAWMTARAVNEEGAQIAVAPLAHAQQALLAGRESAPARRPYPAHAGLGHGLGRDETHVGPPHRFADGLGVVGVVLLVFDVGFDELRRDHLDRVAPAQASMPIRQERSFSK